MVAHGGATGEGFLALGHAILRRSELDQQLRELAILRVDALCGSHYEAVQHRRVAAQAGVPAAKIDAALRNPQGDPETGAASRSRARVVAGLLEHLHQAVRRTPGRRADTSQPDELPNGKVTPLFQAAMEATQEAVYNAIVAATTMSDSEGHTLDALPIDDLRAVLSAHDITAEN